MMDYQIIRSVPELEAVAEEWNGLLAESASDVPFLRYEYIKAWWETRGGGEWDAAQAQLAVVIARRNGELVGIAPLFAAANRQGQPALLLLGSIEISDYLDIIARPQYLPEFIEGLLPFLAEADLPPWETLDWYNVLESSATLPLLEQAARTMQWEYSAERLQHSPYIPLPGDWETYLVGIDKKQRHEVRRKMRRLETAEAPSRWYIVEDRSTLDAETEAFLDLMAQDPEKEKFLTDLMRQQMHATVRQFFDEGFLQLAFLEIGGKKAAAYLNFDYQNRIWVYNSGLDFNFREFSPGWVLVGYLLQWANDQKRSVFDFLRGNEEYKYRFGAIDRFVMRAQVQRNGPEPR